MQAQTKIKKLRDHLFKIGMRLVEKPTKVVLPAHLNQEFMLSNSNEDIVMDSDPIPFIFMSTILDWVLENYDNPGARNFESTFDADGRIKEKEVTS